MINIIGLGPGNTDYITKLGEKLIYSSDVVIGGRRNLESISDFKGEKIVLYIPKILSTYPDMVTDSWTLDRATEFCEKYGLTIKVTYKESDGEENIILAQSPKAGEEVFDGETFKVVVSKKPEATTTTTTKAVTDGEE